MAGRIISRGALLSGKVKSLPTRGSFSSLRKFNQCGKRFYLENTYADQLFDLEPINIAAVEGQLLHELLKQYSYHQGPETFKPRWTLMGLVREWRSRQVVGDSESPSLSRILLSFNNSKDRIAKKTQKVAVRRGPANIAVGVEQWIEDKTTSLCARLDYFDGRTLRDFKSGRESEDHNEQIEFYCALIQRCTGTLPINAELIYSRSGTVVSVPVPSKEDCFKLLDIAEQNWNQMQEAVEPPLGWRIRALNTVDIVKPASFATSFGIK